MGLATPFTDKCNTILPRNLFSFTTLYWFFATAVSQWTRVRLKSKIVASVGILLDRILIVIVTSGEKAAAKTKYHHLHGFLTAYPVTTLPDHDPHCGRDNLTGRLTSASGTSRCGGQFPWSEQAVLSDPKLSEELLARS
jgi:hypothetical protein